ncbi:MAG: SET domain-containing protein [Gammaproteobacteria bacterium]
MFRHEQKETPEPLFYAKSPETIRYFKGLPSLTKESEELTPQKLAERGGYAWTDSAVASQSIRDAIWSDKQYPKTAISDLEERLHNPLTTLVICEMNSVVGKGTFLAPDAKPLPAGTVISVYAGEICDTPLSIKKMSGYGMILTSEEHAASVVSKKLKIPQADGIKYRNITAFIQHAPDEDVLGKATVTPKDEKKYIATSNCFIAAGTYKGCPVSYIVTSQEIQPGEPLFISYENYFNGRDYCAFDRNGNVIGTFTKENTIQINSDYDLKNAKPATRMKLPEAQRIAISLESPKLDTFNASKRFAADVTLALDTHQKRYAAESPEYNFIKLLQKNFNNGDDTAAKFNSLHVLLSDDKNPLISPAGTLRMLRNELVFHMKKYNETKPKPMSTTKPSVTEKIDPSKKSGPKRSSKR